jgi:hypothetical protein
LTARDIAFYHRCIRALRNRSVAAARLSLAGAVLLVASLFFTWLKLPLFSGTAGQTTATPGQAAEQNLDGWTVLESGDTVLLFIALIAIGLVALRSIEGPWLLVLAVGALAVVVPFLFSSVPMTEVYKQVYSGSGYTYEAAKGTGVWIASAGTLVLLLAGVIQARDWLPGREPRAAESGSAPARRTRRVPAGRDAGGEDASSERGEDPSWGWRSRR